MRFRGVTVSTFALLTVLPAVRGQDTIVGSPHDLSAFGPGSVHALFEEQVCIFCHAPHNATGQRPLWNRSNFNSHYRIYESSTIDARIDQPSGPSKMCLSCHDGAIAIGLVASRPATDPIEMTRRTMPPGRSDLTEDLSDDHPIGFRYDRALANRDHQIKNPDLISPDLPMGAHHEVHCTTCHDPHNNSLGDFLRESNLRSAICLSCHDMQGWPTSSHATSGIGIRNRNADPRERLPYHTVADNACTSCHEIHAAGSRERLLRFPHMEQNCVNCHDGSVARVNIEAEMRKPSAHRLLISSRSHDPNEDPRVMAKHVECVDCHNPHAVQHRVRTLASPVLGGRVAPPNRYVSGVGRFGNDKEHASFEYEICFKCHGDSIRSAATSSITRQITQTNTRLEFQPSNPSFHPVIGPRNNSDVVSLIPPLRQGSMVTCTDCHNSDTAGSGGFGLPSGPHGSIYKPLLIDNYSTDDFTLESPRAYALCYRCHERQSILSDQSFPLHSEHIVRGRAPCSACHDAHGISKTQGNATGNSNLINFDRTIVQPVSGSLGRTLGYQDMGVNRGSCTLTCHGVVHVGFEYGR